MGREESTGREEGGAKKEGEGLSAFSSARAPPSSSSRSSYSPAAPTAASMRGPYMMAPYLGQSGKANPARPPYKEGAVSTCHMRKITRPYEDGTTHLPYKVLPYECVLPYEEIT